MSFPLSVVGPAYNDIKEKYSKYSLNSSSLAILKECSTICGKTSTEFLDALASHVMKLSVGRSVTDTFFQICS